jgi:hypothetical protein
LDDVALYWEKEYWNIEESALGRRSETPQFNLKSYVGHSSGGTSRKLICQSKLIGQDLRWIWIFGSRYHKNVIKSMKVVIILEVKCGKSRKAAAGLSSKECQRCEVG